MLQFSRLLLRFAFLLLGAASISASAQNLADRVLVVYNRNGEQSQDVAKYYASKRGIPAANLCKIDTDVHMVKEDQFVAEVKKPIQNCLDKAGKDKILYIVMSYLTPFGVSVHGTGYALDAFLADIWDEFLPFRGAEQNEIQPYFGHAQSEGNLYEPYVPLATYREKPGAKRIYSVWRLDAATPALAKGLVDKAMNAEANGLHGQACFDRRYGPNINGVADSAYGAGDWDLFRAAEFARKAGFSVLEDTHPEEFGTAPAPLRCEGAALYAGWYSLGHYNDAFTWAPGAIGIHLDSASATNTRSGRSWAANALQHGITVTSGAVDEPYLDNLPHPDQIFLYLLQGANVGDAFLRGTRMLKWRILNMGDPLYRPYPGGAHMVVAQGPELILALLPPVTLSDTASGGIAAMSPAPMPADVPVTLHSDHPTLVEVPGGGTIPQATGVFRFPVQVKQVSQDMVNVRVSAATPAGLRVTNTLAVYSIFGSVEMAAKQVKSQTNVTGVVKLRRPANEPGVKVSLVNNRADLITLPSELTIPAGATQGTFTVMVRSANEKTPVVITATCAGLSKTASLDIVP